MKKLSIITFSLISLCFCANIFSKNIFQKKYESPEQAFNVLITKPGILVNKQKREQNLHNLATMIINDVSSKTSIFLGSLVGKIEHGDILKQAQDRIKQNKSAKNVIQLDENIQSISNFIQDKFNLDDQAISQLAKQIKEKVAEVEKSVNAYHKQEEQKYKMLKNALDSGETPTKSGQEYEDRVKQLKEEYPLRSEAARDEKIKSIIEEETKKIIGNYINKKLSSVKSYYKQIINALDAVGTAKDFPSKLSFENLLKK